jgi:hypothetical protein
MTTIQSIRGLYFSTLRINLGASHKNFNTFYTAGLRNAVQRNTS